MLTLAIGHLDAFEPLDHPTSDLTGYDETQWEAVIGREILAVETPSDEQPFDLSSAQLRRCDVPYLPLGSSSAAFENDVSCTPGTATS